MEENIQLNAHNKEEYPPMHTAEHILNQTMVRMFGCPRSRNAHIERKKSKCDYLLAECPTPEQVQAIEDKVNEVIAAALPVTIEFVPLSEAGAIVDLSKLPENVSQTLRIVRVTSPIPRRSGTSGYSLMTSPTDGGESASRSRDRGVAR